MHMKTGTTYKKSMLSNVDSPFRTRVRFQLEGVKPSVG